jgi:amino-acid N-acetyltransferase
MPKYYIEEYSEVLKGKEVFIACREGILRDHFKEIIEDIKFLNRMDIRTTFFHNLSNRFANQRHFAELGARLPETRIIRVPVDVDFYEFVLSFETPVFKIIFLERKPLMDAKGFRINALNTLRARSEFESYGDVIVNANFKGIMAQICDRIYMEDIERVHILPAGKNTIKQELFTIEGTGTLIADNFEEVFRSAETEDDVSLVTGILKLYKKGGFLKPRSAEYIRKHKDHFFIVRIDGILVGCCELLELDRLTAELGAVAVSTKFLSQRVSVYLITAFIAEMKRQGFHRIISLTNNPKLATLYEKFGFVRDTPQDLIFRQEQSPNVKMFQLEV